MEKEVKALLLDTHNSIEEAATHAIDEIKKGFVTTAYPFNVSLSSEEQKALSTILNNPSIHERGSPSSMKMCYNRR